MGTRRNRLVAAASATSLLAAGLVLTSAASTAPLAHAGSVIQVTTTQQKIGGPGGCSLEEAILAANHDSSSFTAPGNDAVVILFRKIWERELRALSESRPLKQWKTLSKADFETAG